MRLRIALLAVIGAISDACGAPGNERDRKPDAFVQRAPDAGAAADGPPGGSCEHTKWLGGGRPTNYDTLDFFGLLNLGIHVDYIAQKSFSDLVSKSDLVAAARIVDVCTEGRSRSLTHGSPVTFTQTCSCRARVFAPGR